MTVALICRAMEFRRRRDDDDDFYSGGLNLKESRRAIRSVYLMKFHRWCVNYAPESSLLPWFASRWKQFQRRKDEIPSRDIRQFTAKMIHKWVFFIAFTWRFLCNDIFKFTHCRHGHRWFDIGTSKLISCKFQTREHVMNTVVLIIILSINWSLLDAWEGEKEKLEYDDCWSPYHLVFSVLFSMSRVFHVEVVKQYERTWGKK